MFYTQSQGNIGENADVLWYSNLPIWIAGYSDQDVS